MLGSMLAQVFADRDPTIWDRDQLDITDEHAAREKITALHPQTIINAAGYTDVDGAESQRELAFKVNADAVRTLAQIAQDINATLVHYSTDYVFPGTKADGYNEDDEPGPAVNAYGESKLAGEEALREIAPRFYLLRTAWLYGPNGKNFVDTILRLGKEKDVLKVVNDQYGSPTFTKDVAMATRAVLDEHYAPGIYHTVNDGSTTWYEFTKKIFQLAGYATKLEPVSSAQFPRPAQRPKYSRLINTRGPKLRPWPDALDEYLKTL